MISTGSALLLRWKGSTTACATSSGWIISSGRISLYRVPPWTAAMSVATWAGWMSVTLTPCSRRACSKSRPDAGGAWEHLAAHRQPGSTQQRGIADLCLALAHLVAAVAPSADGPFGGAVAGLIGHALAPSNGAHIHNVPATCRQAGIHEGP